jgi:hypothetical protein
MFDRTVCSTTAIKSIQQTRSRLWPQDINRWSPPQTMHNCGYCQLWLTQQGVQLAAIARTYFRYQDALETSGLKPTTHASRVTTSTICHAVNVVFSAEFIEDFKTVNLLLQFAIKQISQMQPAPDSANPLALLTPRCNQSGGSCWLCWCVCFR